MDLHARIERFRRLLGAGNAGEMSIGSVPLSAIIRAVGTPCYVYGGDAIVRQINRVRQALGPDTDLHYSLKANPSLGICQLIAREGVGAEVASIGELVLAREAGFPARTVLFAGPGKTDAELRAAVQWGIKAVNVESAGEIERLARIASERDVQARVCLRVNPTVPLEGARMRMGGGPHQFGIDEEQLDLVLDRFSLNPNIDFIGLHVYSGTQIFDTRALVASCVHTAEIGLRIARHLGRPLEILDFGGGFGVPYFEDTPAFDLSAFADGYRDVVEKCRNDRLLAQARLVIELGRYVVADAGIYVTRVVDVKRSRNKNYVVLDGGMNHHITATGNFGQVFRKAYPLALLSDMDSPELEPTTIVGPCCTPLDMFARDLPFPAVKVGDLVGVFASGSYGYSASSLAFLSHPTPAEVMVWDDEVHLLRRPGAPEQVLDGQCRLDLSR